MSRSVSPGELITKDPNDAVLWGFAWGLNAGVTIIGSTYTASTVKPKTATDLVVDSAEILADLQSTQARISGGTPGALYELTNTINTNETPPQTIERSILVLINEL